MSVLRAGPTAATFEHRTAAAADVLCDSGAQVDFRSYDGKDHVGLFAADSPLLPELVTWTRQRLGGDTADTTCTG